MPGCSEQRLRHNYRPKIADEGHPHLKIKMFFDEHFAED
jgi:hypothetical protein